MREHEDAMTVQYLVVVDDPILCGMPGCLEPAVSLLHLQQDELDEVFARYHEFALCLPCWQERRAQYAREEWCLPAAEYAPGPSGI